MNLVGMQCELPGGRGMVVADIGVNGNQHLAVTLTNFDDGSYSFGLVTFELDAAGLIKAQTGNYIQLQPACVISLIRGLQKAYRMSCSLQSKR